MSGHNESNFSSDQGQEESTQDFFRRFERGMLLTPEGLSRLMKEKNGEVASFIYTKTGFYVSDRERSEHRELYQDMQLSQQKDALIDAGILVFFQDEVVVMGTSAYLDAARDISYSKWSQLEQRAAKTIPYLQSLAGTEFRVVDRR